MRLRLGTLSRVAPGEVGNGNEALSTCEAVTMPACLSCADTGHVCENHPDRPWGPMCCTSAAFSNLPCEHGACGCGAGEPCPACCPSGPLVSIADAFTPRFREVR